MKFKCKVAGVYPLYLICWMLIAEVTPTTVDVKLRVPRHQDVCGILHSNAQFDDPHRGAAETFPWVVAINYRQRRGRRRVDTFRCLGALITDRHVLTSASCVDVDWWLLAIDFVRVGKYDGGVECVKNLLDNECTASTLDVQVDGVVIFPTYDALTLADNIAIIKLTPNVTYTDYVRPICWHQPHEISNNMKYNYSYWTNGYAMLDKNKIIKKPAREEISDEECATKLAHYFERDAYNMTRNTFCTRDNALSPSTPSSSLVAAAACIMDAGSPLFYRNDTDGRWYQRGVSSFNSNCTAYGITSYTRLASYLPWIAESVRKLV